MLNNAPSYSWAEERKNVLCYSVTELKTVYTLAKTIVSNQGFPKNSENFPKLKYA